MAEIHTVSKAKIPHVYAFPVSKTTIEECLRSLPQESFGLEFVMGSNEKNDHRTIVLWAWHGENSGWLIRIHAVPQALLQPIKAALASTGLVGLRTWFDQQASNTSNTRQPNYFRIDFDGQKLQFVEDEI